MAFHHRAFGELHAQLELGPPAIRQKQADRLEQFLLAFRPDRDYPFDLLYYAVTGFRPVTPSELLLPGDSVIGDLHVLLELLSSSAPEDAAEAPEAVYTLEAVAERCSVCVRTVHRWRRRGLVARRYRFPDGRVRMGVRASALALFRRRRAGMVARSAAFTRLGPAEQAEVVRMVTKLRRRGALSLSRAVARVAAKLARSPESIRQVVVRASAEGQDPELLRPTCGRLSEQARRRLYAEYSQGTPVAVLTERYGRSRASVYRIVNQERARSALEPAVQWVHSAAFEAADAEDTFWSAALQSLTLNLESSPDLSSADLQKGQAVALFRAYNYAKFALGRLRDRADWRRYIPRKLVRRAEELRHRCLRLRAVLRGLYIAEVARVGRQHVASYGGDGLGPAGAECLAERIESYNADGRVTFEQWLRLELQKRYARRGQGQAFN
jgi:RNA polymerase primary sigma factor